MSHTARALWLSSHLSSPLSAPQPRKQENPHKKRKKAKQLVFRLYLCLAPPTGLEPVAS